MRSRLPLALVVGAASLFAACSSTPVATPAAPTRPAADTSAAAAPRVTPQPVTISRDASTPLPPPADSRASPPSERSVYFDFDDFAVKSDYDTMLARHGALLAANPGLAIKIEGHTDERGSAEYNLALGQKRAQAVLSALTLLGAKDRQMEATSWGKERPRSLGHDEAAWAQNRRADLVYPTP